jgi:hypothetical protein
LQGKSGQTNILSALYPSIPFTAHWALPPGGWLGGSGGDFLWRWWGPGVSPQGPLLGLLWVAASLGLCLLL